MLALVLEDFNRLGLHEVQTPQPGPDEVLIRVRATGICGSDVHGFTGENGRRFPGQIMGHESAGYISALGSEVPAEQYPVDSPVTFNPVILPPDALERFAGREQHCPEKTVVGVAPHYNAAFAEYVLVPARNIVALGDGFPVHLGALIEPLAVALHAVRRAGSVAGRKVLVIGGGPIGQSVILALRLEGAARIAVSEVDAARRDLCSRLGADGLDPAGGDLALQVRNLFGGPADLAVDAVGISVTVNAALQATSLGGTVVLVGMGSPQLDLNAFAISTEERTVTGSFTYSAAEFSDAAAWSRSNQELMATLVSRVVPPEEAGQQFSALAVGDGLPGKVLVAFDGFANGGEA
jgi:threonine dehydrogenase-like Zn-dependent dehydrogenase